MQKTRFQRGLEPGLKHHRFKGKGMMGLGFMRRLETNALKEKFLFLSNFFSFITSAFKVLSNPLNGVAGRAKQSEARNNQGRDLF